MSDIPNSSNPIQIEGARTRSPVAESLIQAIGGAINFLLDRNSTFAFDEFLSNGNWTNPGGAITKVLLIGWGGGGGGGGDTGGVGGGGGAGSTLGVKLVDVTGLPTVAVTIGAGGAATAQGGSTTFDSLCTFFGARGGNTYGGRGAADGADGGNALIVSGNSAGGTGGSTGSGGGLPGGGGAGPGGNGGSGQNSGGAFVHPTVNGGGGGGGHAVGEAGGPDSGASGYLMVVYITS